MDIIFSTWDLAGQEVYYATHQCFLSRNTLYLVVWSMEEGEKGIDYLRPWLLNIQACIHLIVVSICFIPILVWNTGSSSSFTCIDCRYTFRQDNIFSFTRSEGKIQRKDQEPLWQGWLPYSLSVC